MSNVPDPSPALWLVRDDFPSPSNAQHLFAWPDRSIYQRSVANADPASCPLWDPATFPGGTPQVGLEARHIDLAEALALPGDFAVFAVLVYYLAFGSSGGCKVASALRLDSSRFPDYTDRLSITIGGVTYRQNLPVQFHVPHLYAATRVSGVCHLRYNGSEIGVGIPMPGTAFVTRPAEGELGVSQTYSSAYLAEVVVYDQPLSPAGLAAVEARLLGTYLITP